MIHVVDSGNRRSYAEHIHAHYKLRHEIYVKERGWTELARADGLERDQFDTERSTYVLAIDDNCVVGGSRLIPSLAPHLLSEVFPHLAAVRGLPRAPDVLEWTRMFVVKERRDGRNMGVTAGKVICGVLEHSLANGITGLTAIIEMWWLPRFHDMGWTVKPLGLPELISGEWSVAVLFPIDAQVLAATRAAHQIGASVLAEPYRSIPREIAA
jgi:acyl-homoserine lactone synthase